MATRAGNRGGFDALEKALAGRGIPFVRESFRVPAFPQISPCAGLALAAAGAFLLAAGRPAAAFLAALAGAVLLLLSSCGFTPLDWLGPRERRSVLIVPGDVTEGERTAVFLGIPLLCRPLAGGPLPRSEAVRSKAPLAGALVTLAILSYAGAAVLLYAAVRPGPAAAAGTFLSAACAAVFLPGGRIPRTPNRAAGWTDLFVPADRSGPRPFVLFYGGDPAEVKFFLAKYRRHVLRGLGIFLEFPDAGEGAPAASLREGPLVPYRVDPRVVARVRAAALAGGIGEVRQVTIRSASAGLVAMARGFKAVTIGRRSARNGESPPVGDGAAAAWARGILEEEGASRGGREGLTGGSNGV